MVSFDTLINLGCVSEFLHYAKLLNEVSLPWHNGLDSNTTHPPNLPARRSTNNVKYQPLRRNEIIEQSLIYTEHASQTIRGTMWHQYQIVWL